MSLINLIVWLSLIVSLIAFYIKNFILCFLASVLWGISVCGGCTIIASVISKDFNGALEGFALN